MSPFDPGSDRSPRPEPSTPRLPDRPQSEAARPVGSDLGCEAVALDVVAYFDGQASDAAALRARRHLDSCRECARMWRDWGDARFVLRSARLPAPPSDWPGSLVQRARLNSLLPSLFAVPPSPEEASAPEPLGSLREAILDRTTRAPLAAEQSPVGSIENRLSRLDEARGLSKWSRTSAYAVPALAAWVLVLSLLPAPPGPAPSPSLDVSVEASHVARPAPLESASASPSAPRAAAARPGAKPSLGARLAQALRPSNVAPSAERAAPAPALGAPAVASPVAPARLEAARSVAPASAVAAVAQQDTPSSTWRPLTRSAASARATTAPRQEVTVALLPQARARRAGGARLDRAPVASGAPGAVIVRLPEADRAEPSWAPPSAVLSEIVLARDETNFSLSSDAVVEPVTLAVARDLNDERPDEIGDAIDAYAATWLDEDDTMLQ